MRRKSRAHRREQQNKKWAFPDPLSITSSPSHQIRVFIADSHEVVRAGVCKLLEGERDLEIVGEADNAKGVLSESGRTKPDVVLLESGPSVGSEFNIYKTLFNVLPSVRIISLMRDDDTEAFRNAVEAGVQRVSAGEYRSDRTDSGDSYCREWKSLSRPGDANQTFRLLRARRNSICSPSILHILSPQGTASDRAHRRRGYQQRDRHQAGAVRKDGKKLHCQHFRKITNRTPHPSGCSLHEGATSEFDT
jgi:DNA-binding NarL/FixJ family response regulator